jgi:hypothetical protein
VLIFDEIISSHITKKYIISPSIQM